MGHEAGQLINLVSESQGGKCVTDRLILTAGGLRYLSNLIDDYGEGYHNAVIGLLGEKGEKVNTSHVYKEYTDNIYRITTRGHYTIEGTPEHRVQIKAENGDLVLRRLDEIQIGDLVPFHIGTNLYGNINTINYTPITAGSRAKACTIPKIVTKELAELFGYFVADGTYGTKRCLRFNNSQKEIQDRIIYLSKFLFGVEPTIEIDKISIFSIEVANFFRSMFGNPKAFTARYKYTPPFVLTGSKEVQQSFLRAYLDCDGGVVKGSEYEFSSASLRLFEEVRAMLNNMGVFCSCSLREGVTIGEVAYNHTYYRGRVGSVWFRTYIKEIGTINSIKEFATIASTHTWDESKEGNCIYLRVEDKQHYTDKDVAVYDVTVPNNHLFMTVGFVNHNTALCNEAIANAYHRFKDKFKWVYDGTCESGNTFDTERLYGIEIIPKKGAVKSKTIQEAFCNMVEFLNGLEKDEFGIYVLDSIDAITSDEVEDISEERLKAHKSGKEYDKGSYQGQKPKFLSSEFLPKIASLAEEKNCLVIVVSQLRDNVGGGGYAPKDKVSNGRALLFYCSSRIWLKTKAEIERAGRQIGTIVEAETRKARGPKPYRKCFYIFYYEYGIDDVGGNVDFLYDLRTEAKGELAKRAANAIEWDGAEYTREDLIGFIEANGLEEELRNRAIAKWNALEEEASKETASRKRRF